MDPPDPPVRDVKQVHSLRHDDFRATLVVPVSPRHPEHAGHSVSFGDRLALLEAEIGRVAPQARNEFDERIAPTDTFRRAGTVEDDVRRENLFRTGRV
jgi:hypothetical protein